MLGDDAGETERNGRLHVSFAYLIFFPLQLLFLPFLIRRLLDLELERRYKSFRNVNRSKKTRPDTRHKMRLVCLLITFENNTGRMDGPTDRRTDGRTRPLIEMRRRI